MKKFSRCALIFILVTILCGVGGFIYGINVLQPMYTSVAELYVIPGEEKEASLRAKDGGLNDDFAAVITNAVVINEAQSRAGTSEDIAGYLKIVMPKNSNIVRVECTNPDSGTAKSYVDAVANAAVNNVSKIIPVETVKVLSKGTVSSYAYRPKLPLYTIGIAGLGAAICLFVELIVLLCMSAFKKNVDNSDDELEYERNYGKYAAISRDDILTLKNVVAEAAATEQSASKVTESKEKTKGADVIDEDIIDEEDNEELPVEDVKDDAKGDLKPEKKHVNIIGRIKK